MYHDLIECFIILLCLITLWHLFVLQYFISSQFCQRFFEEQLKRIHYLVHNKIIKVISFFILLIYRQKKQQQKIVKNDAVINDNNFLLLWRKKNKCICGPNKFCFLHNYKILYKISSVFYLDVKLRHISSRIIVTLSPVSS
jgi:hypothetical protein